MNMKKMKWMYTEDDALTLLGGYLVTGNTKLS